MKKVKSLYSIHFFSNLIVFILCISISNGWELLEKDQQFINLYELWESPVYIIEPNPAKKGDIVTVKIDAYDEIGIQNKAKETHLEHFKTSFKIYPYSVKVSSYSVPHDRWELKFKIHKNAPAGVYKLKSIIMDFAGNQLHAPSILHETGILSDGNINGEGGFHAFDILVVKPSKMEFYAPLPPVKNLMAIMGKEGALLRWLPPEDIKFVGYHIFERIGNEDSCITRSIDIRSDYIVDLRNGNERELRVIPIDSLGRMGSLIDAPVIKVYPVKDEDPPLAPINLKITELKCNLVHLEWEHPYSIIRSYRIYRSKGWPITENTPKLFIAATKDNFFIDRWATISSTYTYYITALDGSKNESSSSTISVYVPDDTPPAPITDLKAYLYGVAKNNYIIYLELSPVGDDNMKGVPWEYEIRTSSTNLLDNYLKSNVIETYPKYPKDNDPFRVRKFMAQPIKCYISIPIDSNNRYLFVTPVDEVGNRSVSNLVNLELNQLIKTVTLKDNPSFKNDSFLRCLLASKSENQEEIMKVLAEHMGVKNAIKTLWKISTNKNYESKERVIARIWIPIILEKFGDLESALKSYRDTSNESIEGKKISEWGPLPLGVNYYKTDSYIKQQIDHLQTILKEENTEK
ncbi:MAG: hypothetical protein COS17_09185 [Elusimicrobia bacterium CG02_land_8_20_14_3_00_37_13]|nr:MAG: hypothetical protein COS17_09185 [Elusimicrobia bacterium CG02_land_8_20_14_3_00_37_13]